MHNLGSLNEALASGKGDSVLHQPSSEASPRRRQGCCTRTKRPSGPRRFHLDEVLREEISSTRATPFGCLRPGTLYSWIGQ
jgi:hypothetical protein